jgi:nitroimidazol reductase NimA-like FMN-containing flavoprotein (pyridoxamine 5'-phosphate oxidase superfamily)
MRRSLGRIAFSIGEQPEIFPVNYSADGAVIVFRSAEGTRLHESVARRVAFEVDDWDPETGVGWSVIVRGVTQEITSGLDPFAAALRKLPVVPLAPGRRELWLAVYPSEISGRRFRLP